jgi:hypothetical protein
MPVLGGFSSFALCLAVTALQRHFAQTRTTSAPVRYLGGLYVDTNLHGSRLRPAVSLASYHVVRANRTRLEQGIGFGWPCNDAQMPAHWNGKFCPEYLSKRSVSTTPARQTKLNEKERPL